MATQTSRSQAREPQPGRQTEEDEIRKLLDDYAEAVRAKDLEKLMAHYAPDVLAFDVLPPLQYRGVEAYKKSWGVCFDWMDGPLGYELRELSITTSGDVAFSTSLSHLFGKEAKNGKEMDVWLRLTHGYRKVGGNWRITHEHGSVPIDMETDKALFDLKP
jgi:ketosteroid isomerase-like protein